MTTRDYSTFSRPTPHPGEFLREDFLPDFGISAGALAKAMGLRDRSRIEQLVREKIGVTADTAHRLARVFGNSAQFWINLQTAHDLSKAAIENRESYEMIQKLEPAA
jgi:addiction module HigA family antidote